MRQDVHLYLDNKEVYFSSPPEILFTFQRVDFTNPTAIKNSFTKTVTIDGTPENNKVFGEIYLLGRTQNDDLYNPSKRVPFQLFSNGDLVETGYARLDNIIKDGYRIQYEVTLYGGLGDFFYGLSYGFDYDKYDSNVEQSEDEELKLKDLTYYSPSADDDTEFNFNINKDNVWKAWRILGGYDTPTSAETMWNYINFAPAYNGLPDDFDANKVLINTSGYTGGCRLSVPAGATVNGTTYTGQTIANLTTIPTGITMDSETYTTTDGFALAELREDLTEWDVRDLRSYLQRPVLRVKGLVEAIQRYALEKGGYTLNLDSDFFNSSNTYYDKAWITLPMLQNLNGEYKEEEVTGTTLSLIYSGDTEYSDGKSGIYNKRRLVTKYGVSISPTSVEYFKGGSITINFKANATGELNDNTNKLVTTYYSSTGDGVTAYLSAYDLQLVAYDSANNVVNTSKHHMFSTKFNTGEGVYDIYMFAGRWLGLPSGLDSINHYGSFMSSATTYETRDFTWENDDTATDEFTISLQDENVEYTRLELVITKYIGHTDNWISGGSIVYRTLIHDVYDQYVHYLPHIWIVNNYSIPINKSSVTYKPSNEFMKSNQLITKSKLLSQDGTPADYLISYCKLFNLYFDKDPIDKVVTIRTRANFYDGNVIDLEDKIDRSKEIKITPIASDNKWYDFNYTQGDYSEFEKRYYDTWGTDFGKQKVKTEYNFDNSSKDLLEGNIYNNGVTALEKSKYFVSKVGNNSQIIPAFAHEWSDFKLFKITEGGVNTPDEFYIAQPTPQFTTWYNSADGGRYDFYPKLQLHSNNNDPIDGSNILVFYGGTKTTVCSSGGTGYNIYFNITDDLGEMNQVNGDQTCWLYTNITTDINNNVIARRLLNSTGRPWLPVFNRYMMTGSEITHTWDFGKCNELFVPNVEYGDEPTIFDKNWAEYVTDLYDTTTRVVECYVKLDGQVESFWLKHFYYFDDSIWCLTKIEDYNITSFDTTKCQFIKIADVNNYLN